MTIDTITRDKHMTNSQHMASLFQKISKITARYHLEPKDSPQQQLVHHFINQAALNRLCDSPTFTTKKLPLLCNTGLFGEKTELPRLLIKYHHALQPTSVNKPTESSAQWIR